MNNQFTALKWLAVFVVAVVFSIAIQIPLPAVGLAADSTPQAYLPVMLKPSSSSPEPTPTATKTPVPTETPSPTPSATPPGEWLAYMNWLRSLGGLPAVTENPDWSYGDWLHARYMVKNDFIGHTEDPGNDWYTEAGAAAAEKSNVMVSWSVDTPDLYAIDLWMTGPFHGIGILDPALHETGFGSYREDVGMYAMGAALDVIRGLGSIPVTITFPLMWPMNEETMPFLSYSGNESPDPLASCPGYAAPSGPPIFLQIGSGSQTPNVTSFNFKQGSTDLESCEFDETNYTNPTPAWQDLGRSVLGSRDAIVIMPREPLTPGLAYTVSITNNGITYTWSFVASGIKRLSIPNGEIR